MGRKQLEFFATTRDLAGIMRTLEGKAPILIVVAGVVDKHPQPITIDEFLHIYGVAKETPSMFLILPKSERICVREVAQKNNSIRYCIDQLANPASLVLHPGRTLDSTTLLSGQIGTTSEQPLSLDLYSIATKTVRQQFTKIRSYWVGPEAVEILDRGGRLTANIKASSEYDLKR